MNLLQKVERNHGKHSMKFRFCTRFFVSLILMCGYLGAMAQNIQISGVVKDVVGDPLIGVSVLVKGGTKGTSTDYNGFYTISAPADGTLVFSYVGMDTQEVKIGGSKKLDVTMTENGNYIDEVVVIGYGTVKKRDLTGSVSSVKSDDLNLAVAPSVAHALQGKAAGLVISQNSAQPGGGLDIRVRGEGSINGSKTPLYVVDGFPITELEQPSTTNERMVAGTQSVLNFINPADIESIEVLKDASATAIYGSRAANGVVLITTKRGKEGRTVVSYSGSYSIQQYTDNYDVYNLKEWMNAMNTATWDLWMYENNVYPYGNRTLQEAIDSPKNGVAYKLSFTDKQIAAAGEGTDWLDLITRNGSVQQHNVSVQGGSKNTNFMMSLNYYDNRGIIENSGMKRYSAKINVDQVINKYFKTGVNITARIANDNTQLGAEEYEKSGMIRAAVQMNPNIPAQDEDGNYPVNPQLPTQPNPASLLLNTDKGLMDRILANAYVTYEPIKDLVFKFSMGMDRAHQSRKTYMPKETLFGGLSDGIATISENDSEKYLIETTGSYMKEFNRNHRINAVVGWSAEFNKDYYVSAGNNGFITDAFLWNSLQSGEGTKQVASGGSENKIYSAFARVGYTFMDRYLLTATFRADGASVFARNHKWGYFPSVALAWNMAEEPFMEPARSVVSMLKPRVSYGTVGNATGVTNNAFAAYYAQLAYNKQDNSQQTGVFLGRLENPDLKWETTKEFNVGLDFALFDGRIGGTFEFFERRITDLLTDKPLNTYHDLTFVSANIGTTGGRGFEFTLNTKNIVTKDFSWFSDITFSRVKNWWVEHTTDWKPSVYEGDNDPIRAIYSRKAIGIMQEGDEAPAAQPDLKPGQLIIEDLNGYLRDPETGDPVVRNGRFVLTGKPDGIIDDADNRLLGSSDPGFTIGFNNTFRYKGFDLNFNFYGSFDRVMMDPTRMAYGVSAWGMAQYGYNGLRCLDDRWMPDNPSTKNPSSFFSGSTYGYGDWFYEDAWYIRLQNITLGYTVPSTATTRKIFQNMRFHVDVNNVFVITPYGGLDPETDSYAAAYPNARTFTVGVDIKF